mmetsp:Transcript_27509/g.60091  ORF Transcript_27509/g.60091 Transcript_27509/m.60091 type:complete len:312 (-) Transcript_27509:192-1127(-)
MTVMGGGLLLRLLLEGNGDRAVVLLLLPGHLAHHGEGGAGGALVPHGAREGYPQRLALPAAQQQLRVAPELVHPEEVGGGEVRLGDAAHAGGGAQQLVLAVGVPELHDGRRHQAEGVSVGGLVVLCGDGQGLVAHVGYVQHLVHLQAHELYLLLTHVEPVHVCLHQRLAFVTRLVDRSHLAHKCCTRGHGLRDTVGAHVQGAPVVYRQVLRVHRAWAQLEHGKAFRIKNVPHVRPDGPLVLVRGDGGERPSGGNLEHRAHNFRVRADRRISGSRSFHCGGSQCACVPSLVASYPKSRGSKRRRLPDACGRG